MIDDATMVSTPQRIVPYLLYEDVLAAMDFLERAFGFHELLQFRAEDGTVNHAEMELHGAHIFLGDPGPEYRGPGKVGVTVQTQVYVDDVDAHYAQARGAGAKIRRELTDEEYGDRRYDAWDPEGHLWSFSQHVRDVPPAEWGAIGALGA